MSAWRRRALELFPDLRSEIEDGRTNVSHLFFELLPLVRAAHADGGTNSNDVLQRAYDYAQWCLTQHERELWNAAGVCFYEHLFDNWSQRREVARWLTPQVVRRVWTLWEARLTPARIAELKVLLRAE